MFIIYDLAFVLFALVALPFYLLRGKLHRGFLARLGFLPKIGNLNSPIWIHAVSVGEVFAMRRIIEGLRLAYPGKKFVFSTVTPTGNKIAQSLARDDDLVTFLPFDVSFITRRVISRIRPCICIIAETEIWPNLISSLFNLKIPVVIVNARVSDKSFRGYLMAKYLLKGILRRVSLFCAQSEQDALRLHSLGVDLGKIIVTGNMKFDQELDPKSDGISCRLRLFLGDKEKLIVAGSTHRGEEEILLNVYKGLLTRHPHLRLLIAPRHPQRAPEIGGIIRRAGFNPQRISSISKDRFSPGAVFLLDTIGQLAYFYAAADIVFVGKSLVRGGGQNILEPVFAGKPVIFGPFMENFKDIAQLFVENKAALMVKNRFELSCCIEDMLGGKIKVESLLENARMVIKNNQGATKSNIDLIRNFIVG